MSKLPISPLFYVESLLVSALCVLAGLYVLRGRRKTSVLPGPPRQSWLFGNEMELKGSKVAGVVEARWTNEYGNVLNFGGCYGTELILIADPKTLQYVLHTAGYRYPKTAEADHFNFTLLGEGVASVDGEVHKRQRQVLNPAFSPTQLKGYLSLFQTEGAKLCELLKAEIGGTTKVVNVAEWSTRFALDIIGLSSFRHHFGSLDGHEDELTHKLKNIVGASMSDPHPSAILYMALWRVFPPWILAGLDLAVSKLTPYGMLQKFHATSQRISRDIIQKAIDDESGLGEKDVVGLLASSVLTDDEKKKMTAREMMSQMSTFILAGQDTTSVTSAFLLYEIAKNPKEQARLRAEIFELVSKKGGKPLTPADYDSLPLLNACIKETLRVHPIVTLLTRRPNEDDALPVSEPVKLANGAMTTQIPIKKGQPVYCSIYVYNRLKSIWGEDVDEWRPDRFLSGREELEQANVGMFANLLTFSGGNRNCIGWRFALMELQVLTVSLLQYFEFEIVGNIKHAHTGIGLFPVLEGKEAEGMQLPLKMKVVE